MSDGENQPKIKFLKGMHGYQERPQPEAGLAGSEVRPKIKKLPGMEGAQDKGRRETRENRPFLLEGKDRKMFYDSLTYFLGSVDQETYKDWEQLFQEHGSLDSFRAVFELAKRYQADVSLIDTVRSFSGGRIEPQSRLALYRSQDYDKVAHDAGVEFLRDKLRKNRNTTGGTTFSDAMGTSKMGVFAEGTPQARAQETLREFWVLEKLHWGNHDDELRTGLLSRMRQYDTER